MLLFPKEPEILPEEGFTPQKDIFGRRLFGEQLTRIVCAFKESGVLLLDAPWGTGKTTFLKMWRGELSKTKVPCVYFDAFANDYQEDAFLSVASQIIAEAEKRKPRDEQVLENFKTKAFQAAKILGRASLRFGIHAASAGLVQGEALEKAAASIVKDAGDETAKAFDEILKARLENHASDQKIFEEFKSVLTSLASGLAPQEKDKESLAGKGGEDCAHPLVFVIDELDRCRPLFALEILEKIKHFFSVPNVVFLLVSSLPQLEAAVRFSYGNIDARMYLEKFYHLRISFPVGRAERPDVGVETYLLHIGCNRNVSDIVGLFSSVHPLSFRTLEKIAAYSKIVQVSSPRNSLFLPQIIAGLCIMKVARPDLYRIAQSGMLTYAQAADFLQFDKWHSPYDMEPKRLTSDHVQNWWRFALNESINESVSKKFEDGLWQYNMEASRIIPYYCDLIDGFSFPESGQ